MNSLSPSRAALLRRAWALAAALTAAAAPLPCLAQEAMEAFAQRLRAAYPQTRIDRVAPTETPGLYEVVMGSNLAYIDASGRYWLFGHRVDMHSQTDLTAQRLQELDRVEFAALPLNDAIKRVRGSGKRILAVFADPDCGHCKRLERTLAALPDVTVYTFLVPLLAPQSADKARHIWCAPDRLRAWDEWMLANQAPAPAAQCDDPLARNGALAQRLRINATPTLVAADGRRRAGALSLAELSAWLDAVPGAPALSLKTPKESP